MTLGLAVRLISENAADWRLAGIAGLILGTLSWAALAVGLIALVLADTDKRVANHVRQRRNSILAAPITAAVLVAASFPVWNRVFSILPWGS